MQRIIKKRVIHSKRPKQLIILNHAAMVKVNKEENEESEEEASQPIPVCDLGIAKLQQLQALFEKEEPEVGRRIRKPKKVAQRHYRLVTDYEAGEIWRRA